MSSTSIATSGRNVLAEPDKRVPTSFCQSLTLLATLGGFLFGYDTANIGSALPFVPYSPDAARLPAASDIHARPVRGRSLRVNA